MPRALVGILAVPRIPISRSLNQHPANVAFCYVTRRSRLSLLCVDEAKLSLGRPCISGRRLHAQLLQLHSSLFGSAPNLLNVNAGHGRSVQFYCQCSNGRARPHLAASSAAIRRV